MEVRSQLLVDDVPQAGSQAFESMYLLLELVILQPAMLVNSGGGCIIDEKPTNNLSAFLAEVRSFITSETGGTLGLAMVESSDFFKIRIPRISENFPLQGEVLRHLGCKDVFQGSFPQRKKMWRPKKVAHLQTKQLGLKEEIHVLNLFLASFGCFSPDIYCIFFWRRAFATWRTQITKHFSLLLLAWLERTHGASFCSGEI